MTAEPTRGPEIVAAARRWIGTPYRHQASCKGAGADCLGLVRGVWRELVGPEPFEIPPYTMDWSEASNVEVLFDEASRQLLRVGVADAGLGDVLLFRMRRGAIAKHLGFLAHNDKGASFIHAYSGHSVVESPLTPPWARRIVAYFRFP